MELPREKDRISFGLSLLLVFFLLLPVLHGIAMPVNTHGAASVVYTADHAAIHIDQPSGWSAGALYLSGARRLEDALWIVTKG